MMMEGVNRDDVAAFLKAYGGGQVTSDWHVDLFLAILVARRAMRLRRERAGGAKLRVMHPTPPGTYLRLGEVA